MKKYAIIIGVMFISVLFVLPCGFAQFSKRSTYDSGSGGQPKSCQPQGGCGNSSPVQYSAATEAPATNPVQTAPQQASGATNFGAAAGAALGGPLGMAVGAAAGAPIDAAKVMFGSPGQELSDNPTTLSQQLDQPLSNLHQELVGLDQTNQPMENANWQYWQGQDAALKRLAGQTQLDAIGKMAGGGTDGANARNAFKVFGEGGSVLGYGVRFQTPDAAELQRFGLNNNEIIFENGKAYQMQDNAMKDVTTGVLKMVVQGRAEQSVRITGMRMQTADGGTAFIGDANGAYNTTLKQAALSGISLERSGPATSPSGAADAVPAAPKTTTGPITPNRPILPTPATSPTQSPAGMPSGPAKPTDIKLADVTKTLGTLKSETITDQSGKTIASWVRKSEREWNLLNAQGHTVASVVKENDNKWVLSASPAAKVALPAGNLTIRFENPIGNVGQATATAKDYRQYLGGFQSGSVFADLFSE